MQCEYCFNNFEMKRCDQRFCSLICKDEYHKQQKRLHNKKRNEDNPKKCLFCTKNYIPYREDQQYCSNQCKTNEHAQKQRERREAIRKATIRTCPICNTQFAPNKTLKEIHCSPRCRTLINKKVYKMMQSVYDRCGTNKSDRSHKVLGYSPNELLAHLQTFPQWEQLRQNPWHLDHIFPIVAFVRKGITDPAIICKLSNLQPLAGLDNCVKNDVYDQSEFALWLQVNNKT